MAYVPATEITDAFSGARDPLGARMKSYEQASRSYLERRSWAIIRLDGRAFHTWTRGMERPFSQEMVDAMGATTLALCEALPGIECGYCQSDEITLVLTDFRGPDTQPLFGGQIQKIVSLTAAQATVKFAGLFPDRAPAMFDSRVFNLPNRVEVANNLVWRQKDARRNAISMLALAEFSAKSLHGVSVEDRVARLQDKGVDLDAVNASFMNGQFARRVTYTTPRGYIADHPRARPQEEDEVVRHRWEIGAAPDLTGHPEGILLSEVLPADPETAYSVVD